MDIQFKVLEGGVSDESVIKRCWEVFDEAFKPSEEICAQDQRCLDRKTLERAMRDPDWVTFLLYGDEEIIGFTIATADLEKARIGYINPTAWEKKFANYNGRDYRGRIYYFPTIAIHPEHQGIAVFPMLAGGLAKFIEDRDAVAGLDVPSKNEFLPELYMKIVRNNQQVKALKTNKADLITLDTQTYVAIVLYSED